MGKEKEPVCEIAKPEPSPMTTLSVQVYMENSTTDWQEMWLYGEMRQSPKFTHRRVSWKSGKWQCAHTKGEQAEPCDEQSMGSEVKRTLCGRVSLLLKNLALSQITTTARRSRTSLRRGRPQRTVRVADNKWARMVSGELLAIVVLRMSTMLVLAGIGLDRGCHSSGGSSRIPRGGIQGFQVGFMVEKIFK